jgi:hypothetical protein
MSDNMCGWPAAVERPPPAVLALLLGYLLAGAVGRERLGGSPDAVLLWLRFEGLMPGGFVVPWLEVTALAALVGYACWVRVERPAIEAVGRWRVGTRRVPSFAAELHVKPLLSVA